MRSTLSIHAAPWVVPVSSPPIKGGAVALQENTIRAVGPLEQIQAQFKDARLFEHKQAVLTPALVNAHIHLELSHMGDLSSEPVPGGFTDWIPRLLGYRGEKGRTGQWIEQEAIKCAKDQYASGVELLCDIGNTSIGHQLKEDFQGTILPLKEYLGLSQGLLAKNLAKLAGESTDIACTGHAPYSTHHKLLQALKQRADQAGHIFSIHVAEPPGEGALISSGTGELADFLRSRNFLDPSFKPTGSREHGSISYLDSLGLLDDHTLCVHAVHVSDQEIEILAKKNVKLCLCPGSNQFLRVGQAPLEKYLAAGLLPAIGTDSIASNPELSMWREMQLLHEAVAGVDDEVLFSMATLGGALALGQEDTYGSLEKGKAAAVLAVPLPDIPPSAEGVLLALVTSGSSLRPLRVSAPEGDR